MRIYGLRNCDTCRKALKALPNANFVDVRAEGLASETLQRAWAQLGADLVNTRSTTWRGLGVDDRARDPLDLIAEHPSLMKRPLIETEGEFYLGWTPEVRRALGAD